MSRYVLMRLGQGIVALLLSTIVVFFLGRLTGNPLDVMLPETATRESYEIMAKYLGLDKPLPEQYLIFITRAVSGDLGESLFFRRPVIEMILRRFPATIILAGSAALISLLISVPAGVVAAVKRGRWQDITAKAFAIIGQSMPSFWLGILLIQIFAVGLGWLPAAGYGGLKTLILPAIALGYHATAGILRLTRSSMLDILRSDFVRLGRIKGLSERSVIWSHALRNALIPVVTFSGVLYVHFLTGSVITETIFAWPGIGRLAYQAVVNRDFPLVQGLLLIFVGLYVVFNLVIDISYVYLDPRIRYVKE
ncbi:ABC transporter permease [Chloroflexota bacterium]